jgi:N-acetylglutamate synthase-like GNAT family acetyltransferase
MNIKIREYKDIDYDSCRSIYGELAQHHAKIFGDPAIAGDDPGQGFDKYLARPDRCGSWIAESDGKIIGLAGLNSNMSEENISEIDPVVITADFRSKGIGTRLIQHLTQVAKKKGFRFLIIKPVLRNEKAFALYVRLGFNTVGGIELMHDLFPASERTWKPGLVIHGQKLKY